MTGETGAGKSILIDALALLLGGKASSDVVRHGAEKAVVACVFEMTSGALAILEANGIEAETEDILLRREIARVTAMWQQCLDRYGGGGPFLFGSFSLADAFFAPVVMRFTSYDVALTPALGAYAEAVRAQPSVQDWLRLAEADPHLNPAYQFVR